LGPTGRESRTDANGASSGRPTHEAEGSQEKQNQEAPVADNELFA